MRTLVVLALMAVLSLSAADDKVYKVGDGVSAPVPLERVDPDYTPAAREERVEGSVRLAAVINAEGKPEDIRVIQKLHPDLDKNAVDALGQWRFKPAHKDGKPVKVEATIEVKFRLN